MRELLCSACSGLETDALQDLLGLVMETPPELATIGTWNLEQRRRAADWAAREYAHAGDHDNVERVPRPSFIPTLVLP